MDGKIKLWAEIIDTNLYDAIPDKKILSKFYRYSHLMFNENLRKFPESSSQQNLS